MIIIFNMQSERTSVIMGNTETVNMDVHMGFVIVSEIAKIVVI